MSIPLQRILVPVDGSPASSEGVDLAIRLARLERGALLVCHAVDYSVAALESEPSVPEDMQRAADELLAVAVRRATDGGIAAAPAVLYGAPARAIVDYAGRERVDAIVMGTGNTSEFERFFLGSTTEAVLRAATMPVLTIHARDAAERPSEPPSFSHILVAIDDSDPADAALSFAVDFAKEHGASLTVAHVLDDTQPAPSAARWALTPKEVFALWHAQARALLEAAARAAQSKGIRIAESVVEIGFTPDVLLRLAAERKVDTIVVGSHGRRGLKRLFLGSVAEALVRKSRVPVAVVRALETAHEASNRLAAVAARAVAQELRTT